MIPFNRATTLGSELEFLSEAVSGGHISGAGPFTRKSEDRLSELTGSDRVLLTTSCTHALELAARLLRLGPDDEVLVPSYTFTSTASAIALTGAKPVFVDVLPATLNLDPRLVLEAINPQTKAVFTVHYAGIGEGVDELADLCAAKGIPLIEDNAHGFGGLYKGKKLGTFGQLSCLSFHETKNVTCGEGGAITFNGEELVEAAEILREKGTNRAKFFRGQVDKYTWVDLGSSWLPSDMLAAFLFGQLERIESIQIRRMHIWTRYETELLDWASETGFRLPTVPIFSQHPAHIFYLHALDLETRSRFIDHLRDRGVIAVFHYQALSTSKVGLDFGAKVGDCPISESAAETLVRLPLFFDLSDSEVDQVIDSVRSFRP
jgi:dTDP-4-amino-4,6-dideoxygalactose transaminase